MCHCSLPVPAMHSSHAAVYALWSHACTALGRPTLDNSVPEVVCHTVSLLLDRHGDNYIPELKLNSFRASAALILNSNYGGDFGK